MFTLCVCVCVCFWIIPWQFWRKKIQPRAECSSVLCRRRRRCWFFFFLQREQTSSEYNFVSSRKLLWCCGGLEVVAKAVCGAAVRPLRYGSPAYTVLLFFFFLFFNRLTSICTYKQCSRMRYLHMCRLTCSRLSLHGTPWRGTLLCPTRRPSALHGQSVLSGLISLLKCRIVAKYHASFTHQQHNSICGDGATKTM